MRKLTSASKAQAAMEFLMTYGWAILVVLIVISVLAYFGVLKPGGLLPEKCTFPVSISCLDQSVSDTYITVTLQNGAGREIRLRGMTATGDALGTDGSGNLNVCSTKIDSGDGDVIPDTIADDCPTAAGIGDNGCVSGYQFVNGETKTVTMAYEGTTLNGCIYTDTGRDINRYNVTLFYSWGDSTLIMHQLSGELLARKP